jgi:hypothetical protein
MTIELNGFVSKACGGERCHCGEPAVRKVGEEILFDDPMPRRHNLTAYICARHYAELMGPLGAQHVGYTRPPVPDKQLTDVVEKCRDRFAEYVELHRAKLTDDAVLNVREAIWRKVEHNQEMVRMCDEALASLNTAPAVDDVVEAMTLVLLDIAKAYGLGTPESRAIVTATDHARAALKATTHTEEKAGE